MLGSVSMLSYRNGKCCNLPNVLFGKITLHNRAIALIEFDGVLVCYSLSAKYHRYNCMSMICSLFGPVYDCC